MNVEELERVSDAIAKSRSFDQSNWRFPCGTPACIAGHAAHLHGWRYTVNENGIMSESMIDGSGPNTRKHVHFVAQDILGLTDEEADAMFDGQPFGDDVEATRMDALRMLDHAISHGEVKWIREEEGYCEH